MSMGRSILGGARRTNSEFAKWHIESPVINGKMRARSLSTTARPRRPTKTLDRERLFLYVSVHVHVHTYILRTYLSMYHDPTISIVALTNTVTARPYQTFKHGFCHQIVPP